MTTLGSDILLKSGSRGKRTLFELVVGFLTSFLYKCSEPKFVLFVVNSMPLA